MRYFIIFSLFVLFISGCKSTKPTSKFQQIMSEIAKSQAQIKKNAESEIQSHYCLSPEEYDSVSQGDFENTLGMGDELLDIKSKSIKQVPPHYPLQAVRNGDEGHVTMSFIINEQGCYIKIKVIESVPKKVFDQAAIYALKGWKSTPALLNGKPVKVNGTMRLDFQMQKQANPKSQMEIDLEKMTLKKMEGL